MEAAMIKFVKCIEPIHEIELLKTDSPQLVKFIQYELWALKMRSTAYASLFPEWLNMQ